MDDTIKLTTPQINRTKNGSLSTTNGLVRSVFIRPITDEFLFIYKENTTKQQAGLEQRRRHPWEEATT